MLLAKRFHQNHQAVLAAVSINGLISPNLCNPTGITFRLLVANLANTKSSKNLKKMTETLAHGAHLRVLSESFPMNTNMTGFKYFSIIFPS